MYDRQQIKDIIKFIFFPKRCRYCGSLIAFTEELCSECKAGLPEISTPVCMLCGHSKKDCNCKKKRHYYKSVVAPFYYEGAIVKTVSRLKFKEKKPICKILAEDMYKTFEREYSDFDFDLICYIPFSEKKKKKRDFNQSQEVANELSKLTGIAVSDTLKCIYDVSAQHTLGGADRIGNVFGIYDVGDKAEVLGKNILLVDDIKTTGASLDECAKVLMIAGAASVRCITFAIAIMRKDDIDSRE